MKKSFLTLSLILKEFFRTLKNKIYKHITSLSKDVYIAKLDELKTLCHGHMLIVFSKAKKFLERFTGKNCKK